MQRRPYSPSKKTETGLICTNTKCDNVSLKLRIIEDKIINSLKDWLKDYKININNYIEKIDKENLKIEEQFLSRLEKELASQKKKIENVYRFFEDGTYTKEMFNERLYILDNQRVEIESKVESQRKIVEEQRKRLKDKKEVFPKIENIIDLYYKLETAEEKNLLLKTVLKKVVYFKDKKAIGKNADPTDFELNIYPNIPREN